MTRPRRWEESGERPRTECRTSGRGRSRPPNSVVNPKSTRRALKRRGCRGRRFHPGGTWALPHPSVSPTGTALPSESTRQTKDVPLSSAPWPSVRLCASNSSSSVSPGTSIPTRTPGTGRSPFVEHHALYLQAEAQRRRKRSEAELPMPFRRRAGFERCASSAKNSVPAVLSSTSARSTTLPAIRPLVPPDSAHRRQRAPGNHCQPSTARLRRVGDSDDDPTHRLQTKKAGTPDRPQGPTGKACQRPQGHPDSHPATRTAQRASRTGRPQAMTRPRRWEESGERPRTECRTSGRGRSRPRTAWSTPNPPDER